MKKIISVVMMFVMMVSIVRVHAATDILDSGKCGPDISWTLTQDGVLKLDGTGQMYAWKSNDVPWGIYNYMITKVIMSDGITSISPMAFYNCYSLSSVEMPDSVKMIGSGAFIDCDSLNNIDFLSSGISSMDFSLFARCDGLTNIVIPENITYLNLGAFSECKNIKEIHIPSTVLNYLGDYGVGSMESLENVYVSKENLQNYSIDGILYSYEYDAWCTSKNDVAETASVTYETNLVSCPRQKSGDVIVADGTKSIDDRSFLNCSKIKSITIPDSVDRIGSCAFDGCSSLTDVYLEGERSHWDKFGVMEYCFKNANIHYVEISPVRSSVTSGICGESSSWTFDNGTLYIWGSGKIETQSYVNDGRLCVSPPWSNFLHNITSIHISDGITSIGDNAFYRCINLKSLIIPEGVSYIGDGAFMYCYGLESIKLPSTLEFIGERAFWNTAYAMNKENWTNDLLYLGNWLIETEQLIESEVHIPAWVKGISNDAFLYCYDIPSFNVDGDNPYLCSVEGVLFSKDMTKLIKYPGGKSGNYYAIPNTVKSLSAVAFNACHKLDTIVIPEGITHIYENTFYGTNSLTEIYIPKSMKVIEGESFVAYKSQMTNNPLNLYYPGTKAELDNIMRDPVPVFWNIENPRDFNFITTVDVKINDTSIIFDQAPIIKNGRTLVPLRAIFEMLGATVEWDGHTQTVTATKGETIIVHTLGSDKMYKNGQEIILDVPSEIANSRTLVPLRAVAEGFGCNVEWDGENYTVNIDN